jgi:hypothetical protein
MKKTSESPKVNLTRRKSTSQGLCTLRTWARLNKEAQQALMQADKTSQNAARVLKKTAPKSGGNKPQTVKELELNIAPIDQHRIELSELKFDPEFMQDPHNLDTRKRPTSGASERSHELNSPNTTRSNSSQRKSPDLYGMFPLDMKIESGRDSKIRSVSVTPGYDSDSDNELISPTTTRSNSSQRKSPDVYGMFPLDMEIESGRDSETRSVTVTPGYDSDSDSDSENFTQSVIKMAVLLTTSAIEIHDIRHQAKRPGRRIPNFNPIEHIKNLNKKTTHQSPISNESLDVGFFIGKPAQ